MSGFIVDCSCVAAWLLDDENNAAADRLFRRVIDGERISAPSLLSYEICNVLVTAFAKRKRLSLDGFRTKMKLFGRLPIELDHDSDAMLTTRTVTIAMETGLSVYDAAYLETASRNSLPLATFDKSLSAAAKRIGVEVL